MMARIEKNQIEKSIGWNDGEKSEKKWKKNGKRAKINFQKKGKNSAVIAKMVFLKIKFNP